MTKHLALLLIVIGSTANAQTTLDHSKVIPPALMTFAEFPESRSFTTGITVISSDFSDPAVGLSLNVEYATKSGMPLHVNVMTPWPFDDGAAARRLPLIVFVQGSAWLKQEMHNLPQLVAMVKKGTSSRWWSTGRPWSRRSRRRSRTRNRPSAS